MLMRFPLLEFFVSAIVWAAQPPRLGSAALGGIVRSASLAVETGLLNRTWLELARQ